MSKHDWPSRRRRSAPAVTAQKYELADARLTRLMLAGAGLLALAAALVATAEPATEASLILLGFTSWTVAALSPRLTGNFRLGISGIQVQLAPIGLRARDEPAK